MRNLELYYHVDRSFKQISKAQHFCVNSLENTVYVYDDGVVYCLSQNDKNEIQVFNVGEHCSNELNSKVVAMCYNSVLDALCLGTEQGELVAVSWAQRSAQIVGTLPQGLSCLEWSPDEEILLLASGELVMAMTLEWDMLWEEPLQQEEFGERALVALGWGSEHTQFQGSEGKRAAAPLAPCAPSARDDGSLRASWRGDGSLVAVSALRPQSGLRCIRIFNRQGVLQATSEAVPGLEMALTWRPSGNLIASTQLLPNKYQVVFFEKNGLRHGEFTLPFSPGAGCVRHLAWNAGSDVLAVWYEDEDSTHLLLCAVSNYHWYVKQSFCFPMKEPLMACAWDPETMLKLHLVYGAGRYAVLEWVWAINCSSEWAQTNRAEVAVVDGQALLLTAFSEKVVPPPMCAERLCLPGHINQVVFGPPSRPHGLLAVLSDGRICLLEGTQRAVRWVRSVELVLEGEQQEVGAAGAVVGRALHHWAWVAPELLVGVVPKGLGSCLVQLALPPEEDEAQGDDVLKAHLVQVQWPQGAGVVLSLCAVPDSEGQDSEAVVQLQGDDGSGSEAQLLLLHCSAQSQPLLEPLYSLPERLTRLLVLPATSAAHRLPCVVGVSERNRLFVGKEQMAQGVTSLLPLPSHSLLFTSSAHKLLCLQLHYQEGHPLTALSEAVGRRVERGSRLVVAGAGQGGARVVLQMPRGNLETITPRALVLRGAMRELDASRFAQVIELFRKQRINLNLLVDHNPELFLREAEDFVRSVKNPAWLSLLAVELSEEDVTQTTYANVYQGQTRPAALPWAKGGKRATVCARLCDAMEVVVSNSPEAAGKFLVPTLTTLASAGGEGEQGLKAALCKLRDAPACSVSLDEGLRHLLTLCDARQLYRAALALYDLSLAAKVAARSNGDPKEYLPFLNELRRLQEPYRFYRVDAYLNRWESALTHLALCPEHWEEFLNVVQEHCLYAHALTLFAREEEQYKKVAALYGEYLLKERKLEEAAVMLRRGECWEGAFEACQLAGDWQQALVLLAELKYSPARCTELLRSLCTVLLQQRRFQEAAHLLYRYCANAEEAVGALSQGRHWAEAQQVAAEANRVDLQEQVKAGIMEHWDQLQSEVAMWNSTYSSYLQRLSTVRAEKLSAPPEEREVGGTESDLFSDSSSTSGSASYQSGRSGSRSGRSSRSGKNRRKQERKLLSIKEGAPNEDLALLRAMHNAMTSCLALRKEVRPLCLALLGAGHDTEASTLQRVLAATLEVMEGSRAEVWLPELSSPNLLAGNEIYGPDATVNSILSGSQQTKILVQNCELLEAQYRIPPHVDHVNWKLSILNA